MKTLPVRGLVAGFRISRYAFVVHYSSAPARLANSLTGGADPLGLI